MNGRLRHARRALARPVRRPTVLTSGTPEDELLGDEADAIGLAKRYARIQEHVDIR